MKEGKRVRRGWRTIVFGIVFAIVSLGIAGAVGAMMGGTSSLGAGATFGARGTLAAKGSKARSETVAHWVVDRSGGIVVGLDASFGRVEQYVRRHPVRVVPGPGKREGSTEGQGLWIARAVEGYALGDHEVEWTVDHAVLWRHATGPLIDLDANGCAAIWVEWSLDRDDRVLVAGTDGSLRRLPVTGRPLTAALAEKRGTALVGFADGRVELWSSEPPIERLNTARIGAEIGDIVLGPDAGWYALDVAERRVIALDDRLGKRWVADPGLSPASLVTSRDRTRVWIVDTSEPFVRRLGPAGALEMTVGDLPLGGFDRAAPTPQGGLVLVSPGAVLELDSGGVLVQSQGGFRFLTDVAAAP